MEFNILSDIGSRCITQDDGQKIYEKIHDRLMNDEEVSLNFLDVNQFASPFFNFAVGQLLIDMEENKVRELLHFVNLSDLGNNVVNRVLENAGKYHKNKNYREIVDNILDQQSKNSQ